MCVICKLYPPGLSFRQQTHIQEKNANLRVVVIVARPPLLQQPSTAVGFLSLIGSRVIDNLHWIHFIHFFCCARLISISANGLSLHGPLFHPAIVATMQRMGKRKTISWEI